MVVVEHGLVAGQIKLIVVWGVLPKRDRPILVHDAPDLYDHPSAQAHVVPVPQNLHIIT